VEKLEKNQSRKFNISWNDPPLSTPFSPRYLYATTISSPRALVGKEHWISIYKTEDSSLPPILNAVETYLVKQLDESPTFSEDGKLSYIIIINCNAKVPCSNLNDIMGVFGEATLRNIGFNNEFNIQFDRILIY